MIGLLCAHPDGFGFVRIEGRERDLFLPREEMGALMDGDRVEVVAVRRRGRECGRVIRLVEAAPNRLIARLERHGGVLVAMARNPKVRQPVVVDGEDLAGAHEGEWVRLEIDRRARPLRGRVVERLERLQTPSGLIDLVIAEAGIATGFPEEALRQAGQVPARPGRNEIATRTDLRHLPMVTIDGADARDFDDAICVLPRGEGFEAWVAIADVAHFVPAGSPLDRSAAERGNSFYFPDRAIPMLPERLANGLCSLRPRVNRLVLAVRLRIDARGRVRSVRPYEAVIRSRARLTYDAVQAFFAQGRPLRTKDEEIPEMLRTAGRLLDLLQRRRSDRGAIDFDSLEMRIVLRGDRIVSVTPRRQDRAQRLIEELMLLANTAVADLLRAAGRPVVYRVHPEPERKEIEELNRYLAPFGLHIRSDRQGRVQPGAVQRVLEQAAEKGLEHVLPRLVLRAMQQACYQVDEAGHFGLAYRRYCHFTSPIRRYSDLLVHRQLKALLHRQPPPRVSGMGEICAHLSAQERVQQRAEWDCQAMLGALYYRDRIGTVLSARISGMSKRRLFFTLDESGVEASMAVDRLAGIYDLDARNHLLRGRRHGRTFRLGDPVRVSLEGCDPVRGQIRVAIAEE